MSARYSNTSSRGREMVVETVNGSTGGSYFFGVAHARPRRSDHDRTGAGAHVRRPTYLGSCALIDDPDRVPERRAVDQSYGQRRLALALSTEIADDLLAVVDVDVFAHQKRPPTAPASLLSRGQIVQPAAQKGHFQLRHFANRGIHADGFRVCRASSFQTRFLSSL